MTDYTLSEEIEERLKVQKGAFKGKPQQWFTRAEVLSLLAGLANVPDAKDAARWRWLLAQREWHEMNRTQDVMWTCDMSAEEVNAFADAAMKEHPQP